MVNAPFTSAALVSSPIPLLVPMPWSSMPGDRENKRMRSGVSVPLVYDGPGGGLGEWARRALKRTAGLALVAALGAAVAALATWNVADPSFSNATANPVTNALGYPGAVFADIAIQFWGLASLAGLLPVLAWGVMLARGTPIHRPVQRGLAALGVSVLLGGIAGCISPPPTWPLPTGLGGVLGDALLWLPSRLLGGYPQGIASVPVALVLGIPGLWLLLFASGLIVRSPAPVREKRLGDAARASTEFTEDDAEERTTFVQSVLGLVAHCWLFLRAQARRRLAGMRDEPHASAIAGRGWRRAAERVEQAEQAENRGGGDSRIRARIEPEFFAAMIADARAGETRREEEHEVSYSGARDAAPWDDDEAAEGNNEAEDRGFTGDRDEFASVSSPDGDPWAVQRAPRRSPVNATHVRAYRSSPSERAAMRGNGAFEQTNEDQGPDEFAADSFPPEGVEAFTAAEFGLEEIDLDTPMAAFAAGVAPEAMPTAAPLPRVKIPAPSRPLPAAAVVAPATVSTAAIQRAGVSREAMARGAPDVFEMPRLGFLSEPKSVARDPSLSQEALADNARQLEGVLEDFGVKGEIIQVRPGPVVTLYELEPAPGIKSSRVIGLADDIARSMSAIAARVAVVPGRNAIGIELPNTRRETVYLREILASQDFATSGAKLALALGKTINGEAVVVDIAKMPHVLVAGTTGSGKSVAINTMILSLLYRMTPAQCRLIMIDPKMLELSVYDGIPHLLTPVVTDPKKAVVALKWTVREMEDRYRKMSKVGVRNIDGFNQRVAAAAAKGEKISRTVQTGFDRETGEAIYETEDLDLEAIPYIVVIIDEMADLMMVAGKDIEGAVQRLAQMARAAGIHVIMATQRPSVDVITGTIKANFPTRISFQVTSKIDSRTILGEMGAEQLLGQGDMLYMAGGGRIQRVHGPFVSDGEVEKVVAHLKLQGTPEYLDDITADDEEEGDDDERSAKGGNAGGNAGSESFDDSDDPYDQAVAVVLRDGKASTSYIQRRLGIGYNRAASIIERMEKEGIVGPANHAGKREILVPTEDDTT